MSSSKDSPVTLIVAVEGRITISNSDRMRRKLRDALRSRPAQVTVDLSETTYIDTSGLATLLEAVRIGRRQGTRVVLAGLNGQPQFLLQVNELHRLFEFAPQETSV
jgi:anti-sigma B factor antagonist